VAADDLHQFLTNLLNRFDRSMRVIDRRLEVQTDVLQDMRGELRENTAVLREMRLEVRENTAAIADKRDAIQANTRGVLHVLDELRGRGPATT
jgi:hypothetical protein